MGLDYVQQPVTVLVDRRERPFDLVQTNVFLVAEEADSLCAPLELVEVQLQVAVQVELPEQNTRIVEILLVLEDAEVHRTIVVEGAMVGVEGAGRELEGDAVDRGGGAAGEREARDTRRHQPPGPSVAAVAVAAALLNQRRELSAGIRRRVHRAHVRKQLDHGGCEGERGRGKRSHSGGVTLEVRNRVGRSGDSKKNVDATTERGWFATRVGSNGGFITTRVASGGGRTSGSGRWVRRPDDRARAMRGARARRQYGRRSCTTIPYTRSHETGRADNSSTVLALIDLSSTARALARELSYRAKFALVVAEIEAYRLKD